MIGKVIQAQQAVVCGAEADNVLGDSSLVKGFFSPCRDQTQAGCEIGLPVYGPRGWRFAVDKIGGVCFGGCRE